MKKHDYLTPFELQSLLWKTKQDDHGLTATEKSTLTTLINYVNYEGIPKNGYEAYPTGELLSALTGLGIRTIEGNRKSLQEKGWLKIKSGKGKGNANHYFIDAKKIVSAYNASHPDSPIVAKTGDAFAAVIIVRSKHERNTSGLMQGRSAPANKQAQRRSDGINDADDNDLWEFKKPKEKVAIPMDDEDDDVPYF
jgi:hypothetical protein